VNNLNLNKREANIPNNAKKLRRLGKVPGVLYGKTLNGFMFEVGELELCREISKKGEHGILNVNLNGDNHKTLIKSVQRDPVTHKIIHLDLEELEENQKIISSVPIHYIGEDTLNKRGMVLQKEKDRIKIECTADTLPKYVDINVNRSADGYVYRIGDLEVASELSIIDNLATVIASVSYERKTVSDDMERVIEEDSKKK
jgi:large subunit ribosomal protein L25